MPPRKLQPLSLAPEARRKREYRRRCREKVRRVRIEVGPAILNALVKRSWLGKADTDDLGTIADALDDLIDCWTRGTLDPDPTRQGPR